jgi:hypothetical protein
MRRWGKSAIIFAPFAIVAGVDAFSFMHRLEYWPARAPGWNIELRDGSLQLLRLERLQRPADLMKLDDYRRLDPSSRVIISALPQQSQSGPHDPTPNLSSDHPGVILFGNSGVYWTGNWAGKCTFTVIPLWPFVALSLFPPLAAFGYLIAHADRNRRPKGLCRRCSYDLRGNVTGICPECGTKAV